MTLWATAAVHIWWQLYYDWIYSEDSANSRSIFRVGFNLLQVKRVGEPRTRRGGIIARVALLRYA